MAESEWEQSVKALQEQNVLLQEQIKTLFTTIQPLKDENDRLKNTSTPPPPPNSNSNNEVSKVSAKLPPFWADRPAIWFAQVEAQFSISGITVDQTKYDHVIARLDTQHIAEVEDIITDPPKVDKYVRLKTELIRRLSTSEEQRVRQLLSDEEIGDRKPSQFLRHLRHLAGNVLSDQNLLRQLWMRRLPQHLQAILAAQSELSLDKIAELADKIMEIPGVSAPVLQQPAVAAASAPGLEGILKRLDDLTKQVAALRIAQGERTRKRSKSRNRSGSEVCRFHRKFGDKAYKCIKPCAWVSSQGNKQGDQ